MCLEIILLRGVIGEFIHLIKTKKDRVGSYFCLTGTRQAGIRKQKSEKAMVNFIKLSYVRQRN